MNGMKAKAKRKRHAEQLTEDGLPRDPNAWTADDWREQLLFD